MALCNCTPPTPSPQSGAEEVPHPLLTQQRQQQRQQIWDQHSVRAGCWLWAGPAVAEAESWGGGMTL